MMENTDQLQLQIIKAVAAGPHEKTLVAIMDILRASADSVSLQADLAIAKAMEVSEGRVLLAIRILRSSIPGLSLKDARDAIIYHKRYQELKGI